MSASPILRGVIPILATPFHADESLDLVSLDRLVRFYADLGVDGFTVLGVLGEADRLTDAERIAALTTVVAAADRRPVIAGVSRPGTAATISAAQQAADLGASAIMVAPPSVPGIAEAPLLAFFRRVGAESRLPLVLQDHPTSTGVHVSVDFLLRVVAEVPSLVSIKAEATPSPARIARLRPSLDALRPITLLTGLGALYGAPDLLAGSDGFNTGFAFPEVLRALVERARAHDAEGLLRCYARYLPLLVFEQQPGVAVRKEILRRRGLLSANTVRHPGGSLDAASSAQLDRLLDFTFPGQDLTQPVRIEAW